MSKTVGHWRKKVILLTNFFFFNWRCCCISADFHSDSSTHPLECRFRDLLPINIKETESNSCWHRNNAIYLKSYPPLQIELVNRLFDNNLQNIWWRGSFLPTSSHKWINSSISLRKKQKKRNNSTEMLGFFLAICRLEFSKVILTIRCRQMSILKYILN